MTPVAPTTPHTPDSAPNTPPRGSVDPDGSGALRNALQLEAAIAVADTHLERLQRELGVWHETRAELRWKLATENAKHTPVDPDGPDTTRSTP